MRRPKYLISLVEDTPNTLFFLNSIPSRQRSHSNVFRYIRWRRLEQPSHEGCLVLEGFRRKCLSEVLYRVTASSVAPVLGQHVEEPRRRSCLIVRHLKRCLNLVSILKCRGRQVPDLVELVSRLHHNRRSFESLCRSYQVTHDSHRRRPSLDVGLNSRDSSADCLEHGSLVRYSLLLSCGKGDTIRQDRVCYVVECPSCTLHI